MCMRNGKQFDHSKDIDGYKVVLRLKDGRIVSFKTHLNNGKEFVWTEGVHRSPSGPGLHMFGNKEYTKKFSQMMAAFPHRHMIDVESVIIIKGTIPAGSMTEKGVVSDVRTETAYCAYQMIVDCDNVLGEYPVKKNGKLFGELFNKLTF